MDVAVLDMLMPGPDGLDVAARLHERTPDVPVVIASSVGRREIESDPRWETAGIGAFVTKPIKASPLQAALASVLGVTPADASEGAAASAIDPELGAKHPLRILLAEDNAVNQTLGAPDAREARLPRRRRRERHRGARGARTAAVRPAAERRADAGDGRRRGDAPDPRAVGARRAAVDRRDDGRGDAGRSRAVPGGRHERLRGEADPDRGPGGGARAGAAAWGARGAAQRCSTNASSSGSSTAWAATERSSPS